MTKHDDGYFTTSSTSAAPGTPYSFYIDGRGPFPDPASRYQPQGVHGPSAVVDPSTYQWHDDKWAGIAFADLVFYELHVGTFTPEGTYQSAAKKLRYLKDLGITAVELMPLADFAGDRNWGYDGVAPFAPSRAYGTPDDLRSFIDQAHQTGLAVFLDVVYNHFGPDGAYQSTFSSHYFTKHHHTPWGDAVNFDDAFSKHVRHYVIENAQRWVHEYHFDGLRLDATHTIKDDSSPHILAELRSALEPRVHLIAEDGRNLASLVAPESDGGMGLSAIWADEFHHQTRRLLAGDRHSYFARFADSLSSLVDIIQRGSARGKSVYFIQNHDQIGNRAAGDRLNHNIDLATYRAASTLLLLLPQTPLLFMGQEWAASTPFCYFTDHHDELGRQVSEGRRQEFSFSPSTIPDPQSIETFKASKLNWNELAHEPHASILRLYKSLLRMRHLEGLTGNFEIEALDDNTLLLVRTFFSAVIRLRGQGEVAVPPQINPADRIWDSEEDDPIKVDARIHFSRPGAIVFRTKQTEKF